MYVQYMYTYNEVFNLNIIRHCWIRIKFINIIHSKRKKKYTLLYNLYLDLIW
jgi:hypothetical protein